MTEYEILDLAMGHVNAAVDDLNRALALGSAYLLCAYKIGKELTRFQVSIINIGFVVFVGQAMHGAYIEHAASTIYYGMVDTDAWAYTDIAQFSSSVNLIYSTGALGAVFACLAFMWSVRHPKVE